METPLSFGHWVQQRRKALGLTQAELSAQVGCAVVTLKKIEQDLRKPSRELSELLADQLGIAPADRPHFITAARGLGAPPELATTPEPLSPTSTLLPPALTTANQFVLKAAELAQLQTRLERVLAGQSQIVFVTGEAGSGKTSLLLEFAKRAQGRHRGVVVAGGSCNAFSGAGDPYLPFRDAMSLLLGDAEGQWANAVTATSAAFVKGLLPHLAHSLLTCGPDVVDVLAPAHLLLQQANVAQATGAKEWPGQLRQLITQQRARTTQPAPKQLFEQIRLVLETLAKQQPLLLLLDDLQWADTASLNLLFHLGQRLSDGRLLLVGAFRPSEIHGWHGREEGGNEPHPLLLVRNELQRRFGELEISLDQASPATGRAFVDALLDTESNRLEEAFRRQLFERTKGYPLFTRELLRTLQERGHLTQDEAGHWVVAAPLDWTTLPTRVEAVIEQRIRRLPQLCQETLKVASIIGEEFPAEVVARVLDERPQPVIHRLSDLLTNRYRLLTSGGVRRLGAQRLSLYKFQHVLFQNYLYATMDESERSYLHEAVGHTMAALYGEDEELLTATAVQLAHHFQKAGLPAKTLPYLLLAGKRAMQLSAYENAIAHFEQGLALLPLTPPSADRDGQELAFLVALGTALVTARGNAVALVGETFRRALALAERRGDREQQALALFNLWRFYSDRADYGQCNAVANQLLQLATHSDNAAVRLTADHVLWTMSLYAGDFMRARHHAEQGIAWYRPELHHSLTAAHAGHDPGMCCRVFAAYALWYLGYPDQARQRSQDAVDLARQVAHPFSLCMALTLGAEVHLLCRQPNVAQAYLEEALTLAQMHGFTSWLELGAIFQGWAWVQIGQAEAGIHRMLYGLDANRAMVGEESGLHCFAQLAEAYGKVGRPAEGLALLEKALEVSDKNKLRHWNQWRSELYRLQGELHLQQHGDTALDQITVMQVESCFQQAMVVAQQQHAKSAELRATVGLSRLRLRQGKPAAAYHLLVDLYAWFTEGFDTSDLQEAKALLAACLPYIPQT